MITIGKQLLKAILSIFIFVGSFLILSFIMDYIDITFGSQLESLLFPGYIISLFIINPCLIFILLFSRTKISLTTYLILIFYLIWYFSIAFYNQGLIIYGGIVFIYSLITVVLHTIVVLCIKLILKISIKKEAVKK